MVKCAILQTPRSQQQKTTQATQDPQITGSHLVQDKGPINASPQADALQTAVWLPPGWQEVNLAVALSGGADSVALLRVLLELKAKVGGSGKIIALHVNHQLRAAESDADAQWCQQLCQALNTPLEIRNCDTALHVATTGDGVEAAARAERYRLLTDAAEQAGVRYLATAHTRDDQIETVLFRILRGTGLRGISGIPRSRPLSPSLSLIRPLLGCSREMIVQFLSQLKQDHRTDLSNTDRQFTRNRLRHDLLPLLRDTYNTDIDSALIRLASQAASAQQTIESQAEQLLDAGTLPSTDTKLAFALNKFAGQDPTIACEALRIAWRKARLPEQAMTYDWWTRLANIAVEPTEGTILNLPGNVRASISDGQLLLKY